MNLRGAGVEQVHQDTLAWPYAKRFSSAQHFVVNRVKGSADFEPIGARVWSGRLFGRRVARIRRHLVLIHRGQIGLPVTQREEDLLVVESRVIRGFDHEETKLTGV